MRGPLFYAKILLFGEYGIIKDSKGLAIPFNTYKGVLKTASNLSGSAKTSNESLHKYYLFLKDSSLNTHFDLNRFYNDINNGMYFDSSIPQGYGIGSSGALVAAVYDQYALNKITVLENLTRNKLLILKDTFATMESFFHGKSSGLDPLNSYLSLPILINSKEHIQATGIPAQKTEGKGAVFLLDSQQTGETEPMVTIFMNKMKNEGFRKMLSEEFALHSDACIEDFLKGNFKSLFGNVKKLSKVVLQNFKPMIPDSFHNVWEKGIQTNDYYLKLCGSGGGGYILGFTEDYEKAKKSLKDYKLELVYKF